MKAQLTFTKIIFLIVGLVICALYACGNNQVTVNSSTSDIPSEVVSTTTEIPTVDFSGLEKYLDLTDDTLRVFNFWATWCKPCVDELPLLEQLPENFKEQAFKLYYISLDFPNQVESKLKPFLKENPLSGQVILLDDPDANSWIDKVNSEWSGAIPATIVTRNGKEGFHEGKFSTLNEIKTLISPIN